MKICAKVTYRTRKRATESRQQMVKRHGMRVAGLVPYYCDSCHNWHLGRKRPWRLTAKAEQEVA
jgi:hypothetical protein